MLSQHVNNQDHSQLLEFSSVYACFKSIKIINLLPPPLQFISQLYIDGNHLLSLNGLQQFHNLEILHFNYNLISLSSELGKINNPFFIKEISFIANPIYYNTQISRQSLRKAGFTRIMDLNPHKQINKAQFNPQHQINEKNKEKHTSLQKYKNSQKRDSPDIHQLTSKRKPNYLSFQLTHRKNRKMIGKIYLNKRYMNTKTQRQDDRHDRFNVTGQSQKDKKETHHKQQINQTKSTNNTKEREGIVQCLSAVPSFYLHSPHKDDDAENKQSQENQIQSPSSQLTAKFSIQEDNILDDSIQKLGQQFLQQEKLRLTQCYYRRNLMETCFKALKNNRQLTKQVDRYVQKEQGNFINNNLQNIHFSLIKLKHNSIHPHQT